MTKKIFVGADHAGFAVKSQLLVAIRGKHPDLEFEDLGTFSEASVDYPDYAAKVAEHVIKNAARGILICGSGIGMSIAANKFHGVRAALVCDVTAARLSRQHNDSNILCLGARLTGPEVLLEATETWLSTEFLGGRHTRRVDLIRKIEEGS